MIILPNKSTELIKLRKENRRLEAVNFLMLEELQKLKDINNRKIDFLDELEGLLQDHGFKIVSINE